MAHGRTEQRRSGRTGRIPHRIHVLCSEIARWSELKDLKKDIGNQLNKALAAIEDSNPELDGVLKHIDFNAKKGKTRIPDSKLQDFLVHFNKYRLRNEDFEFPDLLGAAYEYLIKFFADSAGKKGGEFYTPSEVVRLMVQIIEPKRVSEYPSSCFRNLNLC